MSTRHVVALAVTLALATVVRAQAQPEVEVLEPRKGAELLHPTYRVRVSIKAQGNVTAEVVTEWPRSRPKVTPLRRQEDGTYSADGITVLAPATVRVRDGSGAETKVALEVV